jgi:5-deoxy-glucuronate isomerase
MNFIPFKEHKGHLNIVKAGEKTRYTGFSLLKLGPNETQRSKSEDEELVLVILSGKCNIRINNKIFEQLGDRKDVFSGKATSIYIPINSSYEVIECQGGELEIAILSAVSRRQYEPFVIIPNDVITNNRGILNYRREVNHILIENGEDRVDKILVGETIGYPGQWSSFISHKHDTYNPPHETEMEEIYHYRLKPSSGFGIQVLYNDNLSLREAYMIKDGDTVIVLNGYHPLVVALGTQIYYLWVMAGPYGRKMMTREDPNFAWLNNVAPLLK